MSCCSKYLDCSHISARCNKRIISSTNRSIAIICSVDNNTIKYKPHEHYQDNKYQQIIDACGGTCWHRRWKVLITSINPHYLVVGFPRLDKPFWVCVCVCLCVMESLAPFKSVTPHSAWQPLYSRSHSNSTRSANEKRGLGRREDGKVLGQRLCYHAQCAWESCHKWTLTHSHICVSIFALISIHIPFPCTAHL